MRAFVHSTLVVLFLSLSLGRPAEAVPNLGSSADFAALGKAGVNITVSSGGTLVDGNVGVGPDGDIDFSGGGTITGQLFLHDGTPPGAASTSNISGGSTVSGGTVSQDMNPVIQDCLQASVDSQALAITQFIVGDIDNSTGTLSGGAGVNVIDVTGDIALSSGTLTLSAAAGEFFIFNVDGTAQLTGGSQILLTGGIDPSHVLFNFVGAGAGLDFNGNSNTVGTWIATDRTVTIAGGEHDGAFLAGDELKLQSAPTVNHVAFVPEPATAVLVMTGLLGMAARSRRPKA